MRSHRSVKRAAIVLLLTVVAIVALWSGSAAAPDGGENHCTIGEATSAFEAWATGVKLYVRLGLDEGGLAEGVSFCQYRIYYDGEEACFCEDDFFFGGITFYTRVGKPDGLSPSEARDWLNQWEFEVFLTPDGGDPSQLDVVGTAVKGGQHPYRGRVSYQQHGVFLQLPPGDYLTTYRDYHPDYGWWEANVRVRVLPHDVAHLLGPSEYPGLGSVKCPVE